jgi:hypothetical protein
VKQLNASRRERRFHSLAPRATVTRAYAKPVDDRNESAHPNGDLKRFKTAMESQSPGAAGSHSA